MIAIASRNEPSDRRSFAERAAGLQRRLQHVRGIWLSAAAGLHGMVDTALQRGQWLPQQIEVACEQLRCAREQLVLEIQEVTEPLQLPDWTPPGPHEDFDGIAERLHDLAEICGELDRVHAERMAGHLTLLARLQQLVATCPEADAPLRQLQQRAAGVQEQLQGCCHAVTDREVERLLEVFGAALLLADDAEIRAAGDQGPCNSAATAAAAFRITAENFGTLLAVELLRGMCCRQNGPEPRHCPDPEAQADPEMPPVEQPVEQPPVATSCPNQSVISAAAPQPMQLERLLNRFSQQARLGDVGRVCRGVNSANRSLRKLTLRELAAMAQPLRNKAVQLASQLPNSESSDGSPSLVSALRCTALAIDCVTIVQRDSKGEGTFTRRDLDQAVSLLDEAVQQSRLAKSSLKGAVTISLPELSQIAGWLETSQTPAESVKHRNSLRVLPGGRMVSAPLLQRLSDTFKSLHQRRQRQTLLGSAGQSCLQLQAAECDADVLSACTELDGCISRLLSLGLSPNDAELRNTLLPFHEILWDYCDELSLSETQSQVVDAVAENRPDDAPFRWSQRMLTVMQHLHQWRETHPTEASVEDCRTESVATVRSLLSGKVLVVVGGICRPHAADRLKREFDVCELRWLNATKADRVDFFQPELRGAAVVVLITRLMGHKHTRIHDLCRPLAIPCVQTRYNAGYSVNQIADVILAQASEQLRVG